MEVGSWLASEINSAVRLRRRTGHCPCDFGHLGRDRGYGRRAAHPGAGRFQRLLLELAGKRDVAPGLPNRARTGKGKSASRPSYPADLS